MQSRNAARFVYGLLLGLIIMGCSGQKDLSRSQALNLIRSSDKLKFTSTVQIETGQYVQHYAGNKLLYNALGSAGLVEIHENPPVVAWYDITKKVPAAERVSLTQKGAKELTQWAASRFLAIRYIEQGATPGGYWDQQRSNRAGCESRI